MAFEASRRRGRRDAVVLAAPPVLASMGFAGAGAGAGWGGGWSARAATENLAADLTDMAICQEMLNGVGKVNW